MCLVPSELILALVLVLTLPSHFLCTGISAFISIIINKKIDLDASNRSGKLAYINVFVLQRFLVG
jgi:hypothetical protein